MKINNQPTLYMLIGVPGSGKSTFAKSLRGVVISSDNYIEELAKHSNLIYNQVWKSHIKQATEKIQCDLKSALENNQDIIWDQTNLTKKSRKLKLSQIPKHYKKVAFVFCIRSYEILERNRKRQEIGRDIPEDILTDMIFKVYRNEVELAEGFDEIYWICSNQSESLNDTSKQI